MQRQKTENLESQDIEVRLQWDPDHSPTYSKEVRRAIQLGLKGEASPFFVIHAPIPEDFGKF